MKRIILILILVITLIGGAFYLYQQKQEEARVEEEATILLERIQEISKLMVVEGHFSEIYNYKQAENVFFGLIPLEKKMMIVINAKAQVGYDLEKMEFTVDKEAKKIILGRLPKPEIMIDHELKYYDINQSSFYKFSEADFNKINKRSKKLIEDQVKASYMIPLSKERVIDVLGGLIFGTEIIGWDVVTDDKILNQKIERLKN